MNFTSSPFEKMMKQVPHPGGNDPCGGCRDRHICGGNRGRCKKKYRSLFVEPVKTSGQVGPKS